MTWTVGTYVAYLLITIPITIWVATTLSRNGRVFLTDVFRGEEGLADAVNTLLVLGVVHFINVMVFSSMRRKGRTDAIRTQAPSPYPYANYPAQPQR